jgi:SAM-dependent methyltransferase
VVDVSHGAFALRTYLEQTDVRSMISRAAGERPLAAACEIGAGYGRMTVVLSEFADLVVGIEREPHFVRESTHLLPALRFVQVGSLGELPVRAAALDLVLTFTALQHCVDLVARAVADEISRILRPGGFALLCEETDPNHLSGDLDDPDGACTIGRPVSKYQQLLPMFDLLETRPRRIEPTYERSDVGTYMMFRLEGAR